MADDATRAARLITKGALSVAGSAAATGADTLNKRELARQSGITWDFVKAHPDLLILFNKAINENWLGSDQGKKNFMSALESSSWYTDNSQWARKYLFAQNQGDADFTDQLSAAREAVQDEAVRIGARLDDKATEFFANQYLMNGWYDEGRRDYLTKAMTGQYQYKDANGQVVSFNTDFLNYEKGGASTLITKLKMIAEANGVDYNEGYYQSAARSIIAGLGSEEDYASEIRNNAASLLPIYGDRIKAGENARDIASPYFATMAKVLELDPNSITLDDSWIKRALKGVDEKGNPSAMGLRDFELALRRDDRFKYTKQANEEVMNLTQEIVSMFGYGG